MDQFSHTVTVFQDRAAPEPQCVLAGYGALIHAYELKVPLPEKLSVIAPKHRKYSKDNWVVYTPRHMPEKSLSAHLVFALRYEGIELGILHAVFKKVEPQHIISIIQKEPTGSYSRRIWFLYEWLTGNILEIPDASQGKFVTILSPKDYYVISPVLSKRHRVKNNLPGVRNFCPLVRKTEKLEQYIAENLQTLAHQKTKAIHPDVLARAAAFLLLKDTQASFAIEGEKPGKNRSERWGAAICNAGQVPLSLTELLRLQNIVIEDKRFIKMGLRQEGGFIGIHERSTRRPLPDHISARWQDIPTLIEGLIATDEKLRTSDIDPIIAATMIAFGFVFIHPFSDGNGRIHRYLIHHVLNERSFSPKGIVFPVSAVILELIADYKHVLESYSKPLLPFIDWQSTENGNVEVLNDTLDLYRYFDATKQAEFLYDCVHQTIVRILPEEVLFLERYDHMKTFINERFDMPDYMVDLLIGFLNQNKGKLSKRALEKEFNALSREEISALEKQYQDIFDNEQS